MNKKVTGFVPYEMKTTVLKIISYYNKDLKGTLSNPYYNEPKPFENAIQFLTLMEDLLDGLNYPQKAMENRRFHPMEEAKRQVTQSSLKDQPAIATFHLCVLFRQNASWQGRIVWVEDKTEAQFRSVLELLMLLDEVLC